MGSGAAWTPEEEAIMRECYPHMRNCEVAGRLAEAGFPSRTRPAIAARAKVLGLVKDKGFNRFAHLRAYTDEENDFLREYVPGHHWQEISDAFEERFGRSLTQRQVNNRKQELGIRSGTVGGRYEKGNVPWSKGKKFPDRVVPNAFPKGHVPHNTKARLSTRVDRDGYTFIKVDPRNAKNPMDYWISYARFVWMQHNSRDWPEGCNCCYADHDKTNFDPDNIVPVPKELYPIVNVSSRGGVAYWDRESLEVAIANAKLKRARYKLERGMRDAKREA